MTTLEWFLISVILILLLLLALCFILIYNFGSAFDTILPKFSKNKKYEHAN